MFNSSNNESESIDYDFFETEGSYVRMYEKMKQSDGSKIVTKAIIETNPSKFVSFTNSLGQLQNNFKMAQNCKRDNNVQTNNTNDCLSSPSSSIEKRFMDSKSLEESLLNCLAYNDNDCESQETSSFLSDERECLNNSLSDSTITTVSSDLTSISPFSCLSDSTCATDESLDTCPSPNENKNDCIEDEHKYNHNFNEQDVTESEPEDNCIEKESVNEHSVQLQDDNSIENIDQVSNEIDEFEDDCSEDHDDNEKSTGSKELCELKQQIPDLCDSNFERLENHEGDNSEESISERNDCDHSNGSHSPEINYNECEDMKINGNFSGNNSNVSLLEEELGDISLASPTSSKSRSLRTPLFRGSSKLRVRRKDCNLSFSREELIKIERDNLILLKKIMAHAKPRSVSLNQPFCHKKTSAAINRAKQQKKIEQDNYILYSKITALGRMKKVF